MRVILQGVKELDFPDKESGKRVQGTKLYYSYTDGEVEGQACEATSLLTNPNVFHIDPHEFIGTEISIDYNANKRVVSVSE